MAPGTVCTVIARHSGPGVRCQMPQDPRIRQCMVECMVECMVAVFTSRLQVDHGVGCWFVLYVLQHTARTVPLVLYCTVYCTLTAQLPASVAMLYVSQHTFSSRVSEKRLDIGRFYYNRFHVLQHIWKTPVQGSRVAG